jgi:hypothetical protein
LREGSDAVTSSSGEKPVPVTVTRSPRKGVGSLIAAAASRAGLGTAAVPDVAGAAGPGPVDVGAVEVGAVDAGPVDGGLVAVGPVEVGLVAVAAAELGPAETGTVVGADAEAGPATVVSTPTVRARTVQRRARGRDTELLGARWDPSILPAR